MNKLNFSKLKIFAILIFVGMLSNSCDELFEQTAGNRITPDVHYQSVIDLEISINGVLVPLQEAMPKLIMMDGMLSDMMDVTQNIDVDLMELYQHDYKPLNPYLNTSGFYKVIINANEVLANIERIPEVDPDFEEFELKSYSNLLVGMRAWAYFTLSKIYGEVAIIDDNLTSFPEDGLKYMPKAELLDTLINELLLYIHTDDNLDEMFFPWFVNTKVLLGEIYLEKNDYANAAYYLQLGLQSYGNLRDMYKVDRNFQRDSWKNIFVNAENNTEENIAVIPFKSTDGQVNPLTKWMLHNDEYIVKPSQTIIDLFSNQMPLRGDVGDINRGLTVSYGITAGEEYFINKYSIDEGEPYSSDIVISRAADAHLLLAEALNRLGNYELAMVLLNDGFNAVDKIPTEFRLWSNNLGIRGRAYLENKKIPAGITDPNQIKLYVEDLIIEERAMELAFEGKRWFDLIRIAKRRGDTSYLANKVKAKYKDTSLGNKIGEKLKDENNWYIPLVK